MERFGFDQPSVPRSGSTRLTCGTREKACEPKAGSTRELRKRKKENGHGCCQPSVPRSGSTRLTCGTREKACEPKAGSTRGKRGCGIAVAR